MQKRHIDYPRKMNIYAGQTIQRVKKPTHF